MASKQLLVICLKFQNMCTAQIKFVMKFQIFLVWTYLIEYFIKVIGHKFSNLFSLGNLKTIHCWNFKMASWPLRWKCVVSNKITISLNILTNISRNVDFQLHSSLCWMPTSKKISSCGLIPPQNASYCLRSLNHHHGAEESRAKIDQSTQRLNKA